MAGAPLGPPPGPTDVATVPWPRNERGALAGLKTISYGENVVALHYARERGATEAVFANLAGNLCEGTGTNVFVCIDGRVLTPPLSAGCLAGVTRDLILELTDASEDDLPLVARCSRPASSAGRSTTVISNDEPGGASHVRPNRPRPAVWWSATTTTPSGAPARARSAASRLVESSSAWRRTSQIL